MNVDNNCIKVLQPFTRDVYSEHYDFCKNIEEGQLFEFDDEDVKKGKKVIRCWNSDYELYVTEDDFEDGIVIFSHEYAT